jgi:hypothetical protein
MKLTITYLLALFLGCYALDCSGAKNNAPPAETFPLGDYQYTGYDEGGARVVEGRLSLTAVEGERLKGSWELKQIGEPGRIGPQVGAGELFGSVRGAEVLINLNPTMSDNNVNLRGKVEGKRYKGTWTFNGFAGNISSGRFEATKE